MSTLTLWLLISLPTPTRYSQDTINVVERFATVEECQRVETVLRESTKSLKVKLRCIQATVVKP